MKVHPRHYPYDIADKKSGSKYNVATENTDFITCTKCGFALDRKKHPKSEYDGISYTTTAYVIAGAKGGWGVNWGMNWGGGGSAPGQYRGDPTVNSGCPFCGTYNYDT